MKSKKGFTLIELLVVIAIIALLLAILTPALNRVKEAAREVICKIHLRGVGLGMRLYTDANDEKLFPTVPNRYMWYDSARNPINPTSSNAYWGVAYRDYIENPEVFGCPSFQRPNDPLYGLPQELLLEAAFCLNRRVVYDFDKISEIKSPSTFIVSHDHIEPRIEAGVGDAFHNNDVQGAMNLTQYRSGRLRWYRMIFRHRIRFHEPLKTGGRANILWLDGQVSSLDETTGDDVRRIWYYGKK
jgi:prepilin-type N-terminal cleavage/methylation domain-containing protein/prepilin-type processing-associated H-X9-DG protein